MPALSSFDYAAIRVVPRVDREEFVNAGVIVFCLDRKFLRARVQADESRWRALWPDVDVEAVSRHLQAIARVSAGEPDAGPVAQLSARERFHWLVSPRSTVIQVSPAHSGLCESPETILEELFQRLVTCA